ncbi:MAG TPA: M4 family metallopeptidase [Thermoanaerobaculia bacterium]|nr:M4 family metallopeptidase [Thermoanaerobaculia bacterium]
MKKVFAATLFLSATIAFAKNPPVDSKINIKDTDGKGAPTFVSGQLGKLGPGGAAAFVKSQKDLLQLAGTEDFAPIGTFKDNLGQTHVRLQEKVRGLAVVGGDFIVHQDGAGNVIGMNGRLAADKDLPRNPTVDQWSALQRAASQAGISAATWGKPELVYVVNDKGSAFLAWSASAAYTDANGPELDIVYADATSGDLVLKDAKYKRARNRSTYNANHSTTLPGTLVLSETSGSTTDLAIQMAHDGAGATYDYYWNVHSRDSYNNAGAALKSSAHYSTSYNNAFWNGSQMVYGDGDGTNFKPLSESIDVTAHELTHAVTEYSANLTYSNESGALNEATSDIMGNRVESWKRGVVDSNTWKVGEDIYTPNTAGDALRYMNDPALAGDYDYYPTRYTGTADSGGVHTNSGIANLAFYLMVMGGSHPRGKTSTVVTALNATPLTSIDMGGKIWYRALTVYMTSSTNFAGARTATASAATDLYGAAAAATVNAAWDAVGAPGGSSGGTTTVLSNGVALTNQSGATGSWKYYTITVPSGQTQLKVEQSLGTGDADLYVRQGSQPTSSSYTCRPYLNGNTETCTMTNPAAGDWYIGINAYSAYSGLSIKATYSGSTTPSCTSYSGSLSGTGAVAYWPNSSGYVSSISGSHTGKLTGPSGVDFDLYLQKLSGTTWSNVAASESSTATENISYSGTSGTYRWRVYAYSGSGSYTLCTTKP